MSGCLDKVDCRCDCDSLERVREWLRPKRNMFASIIAGILVRKVTILHRLSLITNVSGVVCPSMVGGDRLQC